MQQLERMINPVNVETIIRYLLNLDITAIQEKYQKIGTHNVIDLDQIKHCCFLLRYADSASATTSQKLVGQTISLIRLLNEEAKDKLTSLLAELKL